MKWPLIEDELSLTRKLHSLSKNWTITVFESASPSISTRFASDVDGKVFSYEELMQEEKERLDRAALARRIKKILPKPEKKCEHAGRGKGRGKGKGKAKKTNGPDGAESAEVYFTCRVL